MDIESGAPLVGNEPTKYLAQAEQSVRQGFIKKVYNIIAVQLLVTSAISFLIYQQGLPWLQSNPWIPLVGVIGSLAIILVLSCNPEAARKYPGNYGWLTAFTLCESLAVGFITSQYQVESVVLAFGLTGVLFVSLTFLAVTIKIDMTGWLPYLSMFLLGLVFTSILTMFVPIPQIDSIIAGSCAVVMGLFIVADTQMIVGGKNDQSFTYSIDDYVFAAIAIYLDIINLFIKLLQIFGKRR